MWKILQALSYVWNTIIGLFTTKNSNMPDIEKQLKAAQITSSDSESRKVLKDARKPHLSGRGSSPACQHVACTALIGADVISNLSDEVQSSQKTAKPRTRSAKYLLRQGPYVENWNSPGCELSELYGQKHSP
ncbi:hypothetical protein AX14_004841 [Amanita brunnescens Koide BX004]|nr:hypothetical protein AX14_004841 [Amanita brunnescens Koide BX004]